LGDRFTRRIWPVGKGVEGAVRGVSKTALTPVVLGARRRLYVGHMSTSNAALDPRGWYWS